jgi:outer membrane protein, heavy metal efflux system
MFPIGLAWVVAILVVATNALATEPRARASQLLFDSGALRSFIRAHQPEIQALAARKREAEAATRDVRLLPNPILTLGLAGVTFGGRNPSGLSFFETPNYQVTLAQTIEIGKRQHRIRSADLHAQSIESDGNYAEATMLADARENLAKVVYLRERQRVLDERLQAARGIVELDQTRLDRGDVSGIDHRRLMLDVVNVERELAENANDIAAAQSACSVALGTTCEADVPADQLDSAMAALPSAIVMRFAPASRPDVQAQRTEAEAQREQARLFENRAIPDPQVGVSYLHDNLTVAGNQPNTFGVFVALPLPVSDRGQHLRTQALERAEQLSAEARRTELVATNEAQYFVRAEQLLTQKLEMLKDRALPLGGNVLDSTEKAYRLGQVSMTDLLLARRQRGELALDLVDTRYALFQVRSQLRRVLALDVNGGSTQ